MPMINLFRTLEADDHSAYGPCFGLEDIEHMDTAMFLWIGTDDFDEELTDSIDQATGALLDPGEADYLDAHQCALLVEWIDTHPDMIAQRPHLQGFFHIVRTWAARAHRMGTAIALDL
ncbi:MAG: hypothetical protein UHD09_06300 [Bifidobacterium sp.]|nr:hypothetical protein [Bifidobacterium sp.]